MSLLLQLFLLQEKKVWVCTASKGDLLGRWRNPARERGVADDIPESDHGGDSGPPVLAKPVRHLSPSWLSRYEIMNLSLPTMYFVGVRAVSCTWGNSNGPRRVDVRRGKR